MKLHNTVLDRMTQLFDMWGGHRNNTKLLSEMKKLDFTVYTTQTGEQVLVLTSQLQEEMLKQQ